MNRRSMISLILGIVVIAATVLIGIILQPPLCLPTIIGMCFLLYAEGVLFGWIPVVDYLALKLKTPLMWSGIGVTVSLYGAIVFFSAILYMAGQHTKWFLILQIVLFATAAVLCLIIGSFSAKIKTEAENHRQAERKNQILLEQLTSVKKQVRDKSEIGPLIEAVRYSDISVTVHADMELHQAAAELQELVSAGMEGTPAFDTVLCNIKTLVKRREAQARNSKSEGI